MAKLLVVDDEKNIRDALGRFLGSREHEIAIAESGREALAIMERDGRFDLVLSDWRMAEMNGLELLNEIKAKFPTTIVILMTAYGTIQNAVAAMKAGAYDYVTKPFSLDQIQHAVDRALEVKELRTEVRALRNSIEGVPLLTTGSPSISLPYRDGFRSRVEPAHWRKRHRQERSRTAGPRMEF